MCIPVAVYSVKLTASYQTGTSVSCTMIFPWEHGQKLFQTYSVVFMYIVPLIFISVCYLKIWLKLGSNKPGSDTNTAANSKRMRRTLRLILIVIVVFALSWLPYRGLIMWVVWDHNFVVASSNIFHYASAATGLIIYLNSVINPFIYPFAGTGFRKHISWLRARERTVPSKSTKGHSQVAAIAASSSVKDKSIESLSVGCQASPQPRRDSPGSP